MGEVSSKDGLPVIGTQVRGVKLNLARPTTLAPVYIQPCDEYCEDANRTNRNLAAQIAMRYGYRLSLQIHKELGLP